MVLALMLACSLVAEAQVDQKYMMPPQAIADLVDAPMTPMVLISPDSQYLLILERAPLPSIAEVAQPELRLGGLRINPRTNGPSRGWHSTSMAIRPVSGGEPRQVSGLPESPRITNLNWAPSSRRAAFTLTFSDHLELWVVEVETATTSQVSSLPLNGAIGSPFEWLSDSETLIVRTIPKDRGEPPQGLAVPTGPVVQENTGRKAPARTYQDLLKNQHDEALFDYFMTSQLVRMTIRGEESTVGAPVVGAATPSPDGRYLLVEQVHRPYSYTVPFHRFPRRTEVWDLQGKLVYLVADLPLADMVPIAFGSVPTGRREVAWRDDAAATLYWIEALDGGDAGAEAEKRDQISILPAPFIGEPQPLISIDLRFGDVTWGSDDLAIVSGWWWRTRQHKSWMVSPAEPEQAPRLLFDYSFEDRYSNPGSPVTRTTEQGTSVLLTADQGKTIFLIGEGASPEGNRPFLDRLDTASLETSRLFRSAAPYYERPWRLLGEEAQALLTWRESVEEPANIYRHDLGSGELKQITSFPHPTPQMRDVAKEMIRYQREDGVEMTATLYLPPGSSADSGLLPMLMWAYPREFKSADAAGQVTDSPYRFARIAWYSPLLWLAHGYAVLQNPTMPIIGEGEVEPNDTYVEQLVASAKAAVDEVVRRGVTSRDRIAIGGHSYGAFMTANLLAHSDLFRTGIARSGAYNRTLTPFGFQAEERTVWQAPEIYFAMSPFMHADKVNEPILLIHGEADNNSGTFPLQSERFYGALKGLGATVRLVMLPHESHGYRARESVMHVMWEMARWLDTYVKDAEPKTDES
jgi:dipeptidyl aminopeptidase/acylaminoacyl peptidase